jgi:hypothetical protein
MKPPRPHLPLLLILPLAASAYSTFGQNKVAYRELDWRVLACEHFDVHFYPEEEELAKMAAELAEGYYDSLALRFGCVVPWRIPVFVYADRTIFRQTRIYAGFLPESVGGFTEYVKGRVVMPNSGDLAAFAHTLNHELVHVFVYALLRSSVGGRGVSSYARPSLWFEEGLAEYLSEGLTTEAEIYLRDLVLEEEVVPLTELEYYGPVFLLYKEGQSAVSYIAQTYGEDALFDLVRKAYTSERFGVVVEDTLGVDLAQLDEDWRSWLKRCYYPEVTDRLALGEAGERRTGENETALAPAYAERDGEPGFVYLSDYLGYQGLFWAPLEGGIDRRSLLVAERNPVYESLRMFSTTLDADPAGRVAFVAGRRGRDELFVYDLKRDEVTGRYAVDGTVALSDPAWDGGRIVLAGLAEDGASDLYVVYTTSGSVERLTEDFAYEADPVFTPDGAAVVFASNRDVGVLSGDRNLYRLELDSGEVTRLTEGSWRDSSPFFDNEGRLFFTSDRTGAADIYRLEEDGSVTRLTRLFTGAWNASFTPDGRILCEGLQGHDFGVYLIEDLEGGPADEESAFDAPPEGLPHLASRSDIGEVHPYKTEFTLDVVRSEIAYDPEFGTGFGTALGLTDLTGDQQIVFQLYSVGEGFDNFFEYLNVAATYLNHTHRLGWGAGAFHYVDDYLDYTTLVPYYERRYGVLGLLNYPFDRYTRLEASVVARYSERFDYIEETWTNRPLGSAYLGFVFDNTLWGLIGPVDGARVNLSAGQTFDLSTGQPAYHTFWGDLRYYLRTSRRTTLAARAVGRYAAGPDARRSYFGGSLSMRGYPFGYFNGTRLVMGNFEWRFPLLDYLALGLPAGSIAFTHVEGAVFFDAGAAWDSGEELPGLEGAFGLGIRLGLGPYVALRFDFAWLTDFAEVQREAEFGFYIGWNF